MRLAVEAKDKELAENKITQTDYNADIEQLELLHKNAIDSIDEVYVIKAKQDAQEVADEKLKWDEKVEEQRKKDEEEALKIIEERKRAHTEMMRELLASTVKYSDAVEDMNAQQKQNLIEQRKSAGDFNEALQLQEELEKEASERKTRDMNAYFDEQDKKNYEAYENSTKTEEDAENFRIRMAEISLNRERANELILEELAIQLGLVRKSVLDEELEYTSQKAKDIQSEFEALVGNIKGYQSELDALENDRKREQITQYVDKGKFQEAVAIEKQMVADAQQESLDNLYSFTMQQHKINKDAWMAGKRSYEEYKAQEQAINESAVEGVKLVNEKAHQDGLNWMLSILSRKKKSTGKHMQKRAEIVCWICFLLQLGTWLPYR